MNILDAKGIANFYSNIRSMITFISQGSGLNLQCQAVTKLIAEDENFNGVLNAEEQAWITATLTFFNSLAPQLPQIPASIIKALQN